MTLVQSEKDSQRKADKCGRKAIAISVETVTTYRCTCRPWQGQRDASKWKGSCLWRTGFPSAFRTVVPLLRSSQLHSVTFHLTLTRSSLMTDPFESPHTQASITIHPSIHRCKLQLPVSTPPKPRCPPSSGAKSEKQTLDKRCN